MPKTPPGSGFEESVEKAERRLYRLYKVTLPSTGFIFRYAETDFSPQADAGDGFGRQTWASAPSVEREDVGQTVTLETDTVQVTLPNEPITFGTLGTKKLNEWARLGFFDDAYVDFYQWDRDSDTVLWDSRWYMQGNPGWNYEAIVFELESLWARLDSRTPRTIIQETCNNKLYDRYCTADKDSFKVVATIEATPTLTAFNFTASASGTSIPATGVPDNYFSLGECVFIDGPLALLRRMVYQQIGNRLVFPAPLPLLPVAGNTIWLYAGCDKTVAACKLKFNNLLRFRGFPYVPKEDEVYG